jgi:hypothetical protein
MDLQFYAKQLEHQATLIATLVQDSTAEQARWKPTPEQWSILEVVCHLVDEEREDFRFRLSQLIANPAAVLPPIDPPGWVTARSYNQRELPAMLTEFLAERRRSVDWLRQVDVTNWEQLAIHAPWPIRIGDLLVSWAAHDLLHLRQLIELRWHYAALQAQPFSLEYAGDF